MNLLHYVTAFGNPAQRLAHSSHATGVTSGAVPGLWGRGDTATGPAHSCRKCSFNRCRESEARAQGTDYFKLVTRH